MTVPPVHAGDRERVAGAQEVEQQLQFGAAVTAGRTRLLGADYLAAAASSTARWIESRA